MTGGGIWNLDAVPAGRATVAGSVGALLVVLVAATGWWLTGRGPTEAVTGRSRAALGSAGAVGLLLAVAGLVRPVADAAAHLPGGGLLRDSSRLLAPWCLLLALGLGWAGSALAARLRTRTAYALGLLPVAVLPALAWGVGGRLQPVDYPRDYARVERLVDGDPRDGAVLVLPFEAYRRLSWNHGRTSLSAVPRWLDRVVVVSSDLRVRVGGRGVVVPGEDRLAARAGTALAAADPSAALATLGVRWVVTDLPGPAAPALGRLVFAGADLQLRELPAVDPAAAADPAADPAGPDRPARAPVLVGDTVWVLFGLGALAAWTLRRRTSAATVR